MEPILNYLRAQRQRHLAQLFELTRFPSVETWRLNMWKMSRNALDFS